ncbi:MAG TPA: O-methyltransferase [Bacteroidales bacterium]|nr:O-methyltransferase [Bacteroidales bacterium]
MNKTLEKYILDHSTPEDPLLEDLFRQTHIRFVNPNMASGFQQGKLLELISLMIKPLYILEIGTFTGYSAICLAKGLQENGKLVTIEINDELSSFSGSYFKHAGLDSKIEQLIGNALDIIPGLEYDFDLVFVDADKREYCSYFRAIIDKVRPGGFIIADNVLWGGQVFDSKTTDSQARGIIEFNEMIRHEEKVEKLIIPLRDGLTLMRKVK